MDLGFPGGGLISQSAYRLVVWYLLYLVFAAVVVTNGHGASGGDFVSRQATAIFARPGLDLVLVLVEGGELSNKVGHVCPVYISRLW